MLNQQITAKDSKNHKRSRAFYPFKTRKTLLLLGSFAVSMIAFGVSSGTAWSEEYAEETEPSSFHAIVDIGSQHSSGPKINYGSHSLDASATGTQIRGTGQFDLENGRGLELSASYAKTEGVQTTEAIGGESIHYVDGASPRHVKAPAAQERHEYGTEIMDSDITLTQDVYQDGGTTVTPKLGLSGSIMQQNYRQQLGGQDHLNEQLTSHMVGVKAGIDVSTQISDDVSLKMNADLHLYRSRASLSAEQNPYAVGDVHRNASSTDEANVLRSTLGVEVEIKMSRDWNLRVYGEADMWNGVATINNPAAAGERATVKHNGNMVNYTIGVGGEIKF